MKKLICSVALLFSFNANAVWLNTRGTVTNLITYASSETVVVTLSSTGNDISECSNKTAFAISEDISFEARARMYSMLLAAQSTGRSVVVSYNDTGGCEGWGGVQSVYRKIAKLTK